MAIAYQNNLQVVKIQEKILRAFSTKEAFSKHLPNTNAKHTTRYQTSVMDVTFTLVTHVRFSKPSLILDSCYPTRTCCSQSGEVVSMAGKKKVTNLLH